MHTTALRMLSFSALFATTLCLSQEAYSNAAGRIGNLTALAPSLPSIWQSYTDPNSGFTLEYPRDWKVTGPVVGVYGVDGIWETTFRPTDTQAYRVIEVSTRRIIHPRTADDWWNDPMTIGSGASQVNILVVDGQPARELETIGGDVTNVVFAKNGVGYSIRLIDGANYATDRVATDEYGLRQAYARILTSFHFGNRIPVPPVDSEASAASDSSAGQSDTPTAPLNVPEWPSFPMETATMYMRSFNDAWQLDNNSPCLGQRAGTTVYHAGKDFAASTGTEVRASRDGNIVYVSNGNYPGRVILLEHLLLRGGFVGGNSVYGYTMYGHLSIAANSRQGTEVSRGDLLGTVFDQGSNSHLHFEQRNFKDGSSICRNYPDDSFIEGPGYTYDKRPGDQGYYDPMLRYFCSDILAGESTLNMSVSRDLPDPAWSYEDMLNTHCLNDLAPYWRSVRIFPSDTRSSNRLRLSAKLWSNDDLVSTGTNEGPGVFLAIPPGEAGLFRLQITSLTTDTGDYRIRIDRMHKASSADVDGDCFVTARDGARILSRYGTNDSQADVNLDGVVNSLDQSLYLAQLQAGTRCSAAAALLADWPRLFLPSASLEVSQ